MAGGFGEAKVLCNNALLQRPQVCLKNSVCVLSSIGQKVAPLQLDVQTVLENIGFHAFFHGKVCYTV
jgi:hypothetical protein